MAPQLSQGPPAELSKQLADQLSHLAEQLSRLAPSGAPGKRCGCVCNDAEVLRGVERLACSCAVIDLTSSVKAGHL